MATQQKPKVKPLAKVGDTVTWKDEAGKRITGTVEKATSRSLAVKATKPKAAVGNYYLTVPFARDEVTVVETAVSTVDALGKPTGRTVKVKPKVSSNGKVDPKDLPVGTELGDGLRVGHGGVVTGTAVITKEQKKAQAAKRKQVAKTSSARSNAAVDVGQLPEITKVLLSPKNPRHAEVRANVKAMKPAVRAKFCPPGYSGNVRTTFIEQGLLVGEQLDLAAAARKERERANAKKETDMNKTATAKPKAAKKAKPQVERPTGATPADIAAKIDGAEPRDVRVFLRKNADAFPKVDGFYAFADADVKKIVAGVKKAMA